MSKIQMKQYLTFIFLSVIFLIFPFFINAQLSVRTSDNTIVNNGDTIEPLGFQGVHLISSPEYRVITVTTLGNTVTINTISITGDPDFTINSADSGLNLWEKKPLQVKDISLNSGKSFDFHLSYCPLSGGDRKAAITIAYDGTKKFSFTVKGRGRPEEFKLFSRGSTVLYTLWGGYNKNQDERPSGMVVDKAGNIYFCGNGKYLSSDTWYYDIFIGKINADGTPGWQMVYHSKYNDQMPDPGQNDETGGSANAICVDEEGFIYITGSVGNGSNSAYLALIMKIDPKDGREVWRKYWFADTDRTKYSDSAEAYAIDVKKGMVYITGQGYDYSTSIQGIYITALSASDGSHKWSMIINPNGNRYKDRGYAVKADGTDGLFVAGWHGENTGSGFVCKIGNVSSKPVLEWAKNVNMGTGSNFNSMDVDTSGNAYLSADRRGATTYFSVVKVSSDGKTIIGKTYPGTAGGNNNTKVVAVAGNDVYVGGRIGISGLDTGLGDGMLMKLKSSDLSLQWAAVHYSGTGPQEVCEHHVKGIAFVNDKLYLYGQVYTGNNNYFRYYGYWYDLPAPLEDYKPESIDVTKTTVFAQLNKAGLVDGSKNGGVYESIDSGTNIEYQDAVIKNQDTNGSQTDGDVFFMKLKLQ
ncbi:MAG: hypothetical protein AB1798_00370 [Spirochaetota bacterium]